MKRKLLKVYDNDNDVILDNSGNEVYLEYADILRVELRNNKGVLLTYIDNLISSLNWEWNRLGGCGECEMKLKTNWDGVLAGSLAEDAEIRIYLRNRTSCDNELWYSGFIDNVVPELTGQTEFINLFCLGYVHQLKRVMVQNKSYSSMEISAIAKNIVENYIVPEDSISVQSTTPYYEQTDFTADSLYFNESVFDSISKLSDIAGKREWGVNADKKFYFLRRDDTIKHYYFLGEDIIKYRPQKDFGNIITRIYLEGKDYAGIFTVSNKITLREEIVQNSSIITQSVGQQFARMYLKEKGKASQSFSLDLAEKHDRIEGTLPLGKAAINTKMGITELYDVATNLYDKGLKYDGGTESYHINKIKYTLGDDGLNMNITLGQGIPNISEELSRLESMIENERNA
jgi:hypothetical protein